MALKTAAAPFPIFPPSLATPPSRRPTTEIRFSRWNNANAQPFLRRQREQQEIEDELRRHRRFESASRLAEVCGTATTEAAPEFKSKGTPSSPSPPSIPGKKSKYSKPPQKPTINPNDPRNRNSLFSSHPAFRRIARVPRGESRVPLEPDGDGDGESGIVVGEHGISYKIANAPFEFQYSYTETPKVKPLSLREPPYLPFGPSTMPRPWTGRAPLPASKKKLPDFDSFKPPPPGKKGVKPVQAPGPYLSGSGPKYQAKSREEILGEPLSEEEVKDLIKGSLKTNRQLNMGRDGLTHNMLDNIHAHWKRRRVCKIKCKGVCTVDMDNVRQQLEEKTGGKVIYSRGGVMFLFRGRNYNYRTHPRFPLMLWKPITPVYPRLVQRVPEGLTLEEATEMRKKGRKLPPICKLGKNGVYSNLVKDVKEAFEECELVRINCQGLNKSDCRKIGAKLQDLVPCILLSFMYEHILMWRGKDWKSSLAPLEDNCNETAEPTIDGSPAGSLNSDDSVLVSHQASELIAAKSLNEDLSFEMPCESIAATEVYCNESTEPITDGSPATSLNSAGSVLASHQETTELSAVKSLNEDLCFDMPCGSMALAKEDLIMEETEDLSHKERNSQLLTAPYAGPNGMHDNTTNLVSTLHQETEDFGAGKRLNNDQEMPSQNISLTKALSSEVTKDHDYPGVNDQLFTDSYVIPTSMDVSATMPVNMGSTDESAIIQPVESLQCQNGMTSSRTCLDGVMHLLRQAVENGSAVILEDESLDANAVYEKSVSLAKTAPRGPIFRQRIRKVSVQRVEKYKGVKCEQQEFEEEETVTVVEKRVSENRSLRKQKREDFREGFCDVVPHGSLRVDELAKLLA